MIELIRELHKKEYSNNKAIKLDCQKVESLTPLNIVLKQGYHEALECKVCGIGTMTPLPDCELKYSCNDCNNIEILDERKSFYCFNFQILQSLLKENLIKIALNTKDFDDLKPKKDSIFWLASLEEWKINFYFFYFEKDFTSLQLKEGENCIIFTAFEAEETKRQENIFLIDIYEFLEFNNLQNKIEINEAKLKEMVFKVISDILFDKSNSYSTKSETKTLKQSCFFWVLYIKNNKMEMEKYRVSGRTLFLEDVKSKFKYLSGEYPETLWKEEIRPLINLK